MLEVGKLYCSKNYAIPILVYTNKSLTSAPEELQCIFIDQPFLVLATHTESRSFGAQAWVRYNVLFGDRKGWIQLDYNYKIEEIK